PRSALANFTQQARAIYGIGPDDRVLQFASVNFDASVEEIFPALTTGATLVLRTAEMLVSLVRFVACCREWRVSVMSLPTAFWHELVTALGTLKLILPESLRLVIPGGDRAIPEKVAQWRRLVGGHVRLLNTF